VCTSYQNPGGSQAVAAVFLDFFYGEKRGKRLYWEVKKKPQQTALAIKGLVQVPVPYPGWFISGSAL